MITVLDTLKKLTELREIVWPVFRLSEKPPVQKNGLVFFYSEYVDPEQNEDHTTYKLVDDKNLPQKTLGLRRLYLRQNKEIKLHSISVAIYFLADLLKLAKSTTWFIDNSGRVFQYKKYARAKLRSREIIKVLPADGLGCVLEIKGLSQRFKALSRPSDIQRYAVVLEIGKMSLLYGFSESPIRDSWRLI